MANNYLLYSEELSLDPGQATKAQEIIDRYVEKLEESDESFADLGEISVQDHGVWFKCEESANLEQVVGLIELLMDGLDIKEPFIFSWACTCSKMRIGEFTGGSVVVRYKKDPIWINAYELAVAAARE